MQRDHLVGVGRADRSHMDSRSVRQQDVGRPAGRSEKPVRRGRRHRSVPLGSWGSSPSKGTPRGGWRRMARIDRVTGIAPGSTAGSEASASSRSSVAGSRSRPAEAAPGAGPGVAVEPTLDQPAPQAKGQRGRVDRIAAEAMAKAAGWVHARGTTSTRAYPPPPVATPPPAGRAPRPVAGSAPVVGLARCPAVHGEPEVGQRVQPMGVGAALGEQHLRANARNAAGTTAWKARSQPESPVPGGSATLIAVPGAAGPPVSLAKPVPGNNVNGVSCRLMVSTAGRPRTSPEPHRRDGRQCPHRPPVSAPRSSRRAMATAGSL